MYTITRTYISDTHSLCPYCAQVCGASKNLYNASLFRIRNRFTGRKKGVLTPLEQEVADEIAILEANSAKKVKSVFSYTALEKLMRVTNNVDFFNPALSMQTSQHMVKQAVQDFRGWLKSLRSYKNNPKSFTGKPKMPHYKKTKLCTAVLTNQDCVSYPDGLKLPGTKIRVKVDAPFHGTLQEVQIKPYYNGFLLLCAFNVPETDSAGNKAGMPYLAGIDLGVDNIAAMVTNEGHSLLFQGGAIKSRNQFFNKRKAELVSITAKGHRTTKNPSTKQLRELSRYRDAFLRDQFHKISAEIVSVCLEHKIGTLVIGKNKNWKQNVNLRKHNNQNFVGIPHAMLCAMIKYKAERAGILVVEQEESYTSKASFLDGDAIPICGKEEKVPSFSGARIHRGLYRSKQGVLLNADLNGAANILRKAIPAAFRTVNDFHYLQTPTMYGFAKVNG